MPRVLARPTTLIAAVVALLAAGMMVGLSPSQADPQPGSPGSAVGGTRSDETGKTLSKKDGAQKDGAQKQNRAPAARRLRRNYAVATLNLEKGMGVSAMRHDIREVIRGPKTTVIGFQERLSSRRALRKALPRHWRLLMPSRGATGMDDNPVAFNMRVWKLKNAWPKLLASKTWRRDSGRMAHDQYGVVGVLKHRRTGHVIRTISFHLPPGIHNRSTGGPNWGNGDRVKATWRMADTVRTVKRRAPKRQQFIAMCDCNVTDSKDHGSDLVRGKITKPLKLDTNYSVGGYRPGWRIDYVMAEKRSRFRIGGWRSFRHLNTDHPGVVARFRHR